MAKSLIQLPTRKTRLAIASGILTLIAACILIVFGVLFHLVFVSTLTFPVTYDDLYGPKFVWLFSAVIWVIAFTFGLISGIMAVRRKHFVLSIIGACLLIVGTSVGMFGGFQGVSNASAWDWNVFLVCVCFGLSIILLSILSLVFLALAKQEFS